MPLTRPAGTTLLIHPYPVSGFGLNNVPSKLIMDLRKRMKGHQNSGKNKQF